MPAQGWKVHVSTTMDEAEDVLAAVWDFCVDRRVAFKFLRDRNAILLANTKYANRGASGKFVTIYPADEGELESVLTGLDAELAGRPGPYILSDLRWGDGPLYVRYGGFAERWTLSESGEAVLAIEDGDGDLVPDRRGPQFQVPSWVTLPAFLQPHLDAGNSVTVEGLDYRMEPAIHFSNRGGLDVQTARDGAARVVLKEGRPRAGLDVAGRDSVSRRRRERDMLARLAGLDAVPELREHFTLGDHEFVAMEFVDAEPLRARLVDRYPLVRD